MSAGRWVGVAGSSTVILASGVLALVGLLLGLAHLASEASRAGEAPAQPGPGEQVTEIRLPYEPLSRAISVFVTGSYVEYGETWYFSPGDFRGVVENASLARLALADVVLDRLCGCSVRVYSLGGFSVNEEEASITLSLTIHPVVSRVGERTVVDMGWLFQSLRANITLLDFRAEGTTLAWEGVLGGVPTKIVVELPPVGGEYTPQGGEAGYSETKVWWRSGEEGGPSRWLP